MAERDFPEQVTTPEYWEGHSPFDRCRPLPQRDNLNLLAYLKRLSYAQDVMTDFLKSSSDGPVKVFKDREEFSFDEYPIGTIVMYSSEEVSYEKQGREAKVLDYTTKERHWGIVTGYKPLGQSEQHFLMDYDNNPIYRYRLSGLPYVRSNSELLITRLVPGVVDHHRYTFLDGIRFLGGQIKDVFVRTKELEIRQMGKAMPKRAQMIIRISVARRVNNPS